MKARRRTISSSRITQAAAISLSAVAFLGVSSEPTFAQREHVLIYYDGHIHSEYSDGTGSVADIKQTALLRGLDAVIITDHCEDLTEYEWSSLVEDAEDYSDPDFLILPGIEVTGSESLVYRDHFSVFGLDDPLVGADDQELCPEEVWLSPPNPAGTGPLYPENLTRWVDYVHSQQGIAVHNHPSGTTQLDYGVKHMEVYNQAYVHDVALLAESLGYPTPIAWGIALTLNNLAVYGERDINTLIPCSCYLEPIPLRECFHSMTGLVPPLYIGQWLGAPEAPLSSWDDLLMAYVNGEVDGPVFGLANSDAHYTGDPFSSVGIAKNGVYAKEFTEGEFLKAIKAGRSFATTGPSLYLDVNGEHMGGTAVVGDGQAEINLRVDSEGLSAILVKIDIIKNGEVWETIWPPAPAYELSLPLLDDDVTENGYYRVEVTSLDLSDGHYEFAWSNPVFVEIY
jgi:hypothetical protein